MAGVTSGDQFEVVDDLTIKMTADVANNLVNLNNVMHNTSAVSPFNWIEYVVLMIRCFRCLSGVSPAADNVGDSFVAFDTQNQHMVHGQFVLPV